MDEIRLESRLTAAEQLSGSNRRRLDDVERRQDNLDKLVASVAVMAKEQEHIKDDVTEIRKDVKELTGKPGRRWDSMADKALWALLAAVIAYALGQLGL